MSTDIVGAHGRSCPELPVLQSLQFLMIVCVNSKRKLLNDPILEMGGIMGLRINSSRLNTRSS
jgi:hypothetical protein